MVNFLSGILFVILVNLLSVANIPHTACFSSVCDTILTTLSEENISEKDFETSVSESGNTYLHDYDSHPFNLNNSRRRCSRTGSSKNFRVCYTEDLPGFNTRLQKNISQKSSDFSTYADSNKAFIKLCKLII